MSVIAHAPNNTLVIGELSHYHFYQSMNKTPSRPSQKYQATKKIIPSVPRQHCKAPVNSPLSFIRQQKLPQDIHPTATSLSPQGLSSPNTLSTAASPTSRKVATAAAVAAFQSSSSFLNSAAHQHQPSYSSSSSSSQRQRLSFDENVMVICTRFDDEDDESDDNDDHDHATDNDMDTTTKKDQPEGTHLSTSISPSTMHPPPVYHGRRHSTGEQITDEQRQRKRWLTFKHWKYTIAPSSSNSSPSVV
ncbi:hypothetical protein BCR42DRAFT_410815 [Absidia repens]|uniref:Uncharacterized protein n=1 Tax=Absidia repens TaxID=90262 RepID=A0A1X2IPI3_9FUNG|nr:hypothetical protein BCR42DRAFT_410815 [Absidia repens]